MVLTLLDLHRASPIGLAAGRALGGPDTCSIWDLNALFHGPGVGGADSGVPRAGLAGCP